MRRTKSADDLIRPIDEIERYFRVRRRLQLETSLESETQTEMGDANENRPLKEFAVPSE